MSRSHIHAAVGIALALAVAACDGGGADPAASAPSPTKLPPSADGGTYDSPVALIDALREAGIDCVGYAPREDPTGVAPAGNCYVAGEQWVVSVYESEDDAQTRSQVSRVFLKGRSDLDEVLGRNWRVNTPDKDWSDRVAQAIGGEVIHQPV